MKTRIDETSAWRHQAHVQYEWTTARYQRDDRDRKGDGNERLLRVPSSFADRHRRPDGESVVSISTFSLEPFGTIGV